MSYNKEKKVVHSLRSEVDSFGRKKYRIEEVVQSGQESSEEELKNAVIDTGRHKSMLIGREEGLNIQKYVGKIDTNKKKKATEVFYCDICSEGFKCDMAYLTHINSPAHNRKLGMSMKVKNVSLETVSSRISALMNKKLRKKQDDQEEDQILRKIGEKNEQANGIKRQRRVKRNVEQQNRDLILDQDNNQEEQQDKNQDQGNNQDQQQQNLVKAQDQVKEQEQQVQKQMQKEEQQLQLDSNQQAEQQMIMMMGFGSKKQKR